VHTQTLGVQHCALLTPCIPSPSLSLPHRSCAQLIARHPWLAPLREAAATLHLTLAVMALVGEASNSDAVLVMVAMRDAVAEWQAAELSAAGSNPHMRLQMRGVGVFGSTVLWAAPAETPALASLRRLVTLLRRHLSNTGTLVEDHAAWIPHATLFKGRPGAGKPASASLASVAEECRDATFGDATITVSSISLSCMGARDKVRGARWLRCATRCHNHRPRSPAGRRTAGSRCAAAQPAPRV
jgi:hypothetical protein